MAGDYKSYSVRTGLTIALCTLWILLPQIQSFHKMCLQDNVFLNASLRIAANPATTFAEGRTEALCNWSLMDRPPSQSHYCCIPKSLTQKLKNCTVSCVGTCQRTVNKTCKKFNKQQLCTTAALPKMHEMDDDGAVYGTTAQTSCNIRGSTTNASAALLETMGLDSSDLPWTVYLRRLQPTHFPTLAALEANNKKSPKCPNRPKTVWFLLIVMVLGSDLFHCLIAQEIRRRYDDDTAAPRRAAKSCKLVWGGFWIWVFRTLFFLGLVYVAKTWGVWCGPHWLYSFADPTSTNNKNSQRSTQNATKNLELKLECIIMVPPSHCISTTLSVTATATGAQWPSRPKHHGTNSKSRQ